MIQYETELSGHFKMPDFYDTLVMIGLQDFFHD